MRRQKYKLYREEKADREKVQELKDQINDPSTKIVETRVPEDVVSKVDEN